MNVILLVAVLGVVLWAVLLTLRAAHVIRTEGRALNGGQR